MRVLLIEDDNLIGDGIEAGLERKGFAVDWFTDGRLGYEALGAAMYDVVILDLSLPGMDGLEVLKKWRLSGQTSPVLILTARGELEQRVEGLNLGGDDYMVKPFALEELVARLHALVRRSHGVASNVLEKGAVCFYQDTRTVSLNGQNVSMPPREVALVELFLMNPERILSKATLEEKLYAWHEEVSSNSVEVHIHHIRKKLGAEFIRTVYGSGYCLGPDK